MLSKLLSEAKRVSLFPDIRSNFLVWILIGVFIEIVIELLGRGSVLDTIIFLVKSPAIFAINVMIILCVLSPAFLFKRRVFAFSLAGILCLAVGVTNGVLLSFRTTPFTGQDLLLIKDAYTIAYDYLGALGIALLILGILAAVALLVFLWLKAPVIQRKIRRFSALGIIALTLFLTLLAVDIGVLSGMLPTSYNNIHEAYEAYGVAYCFSNTIFNTGIKEPDDYDDIIQEDTIILEVLEEDEIGTDETGDTSSSDTSQGSSDDGPNIIVVQLESFFDVTEVVGLELTEDPIPFFRSLTEEYTSGYLAMPSVGAGTANSEFEVLTGMNIDSFGPGEYPYKTILQETTCESIAYNLASLGYSTYAIHNNDGTFYDRNNVFSKLGFSCFIPIEYMYDLTYTETGWAEDKCLTGYISAIIDEEDDSAFIYTISVQGHGAYPQETVIEDPVIDIVSMDDFEMYEEYLYYVNQLYEMDQFLEELVQALEESGEECVLVLFGDHLPSLELTDDMLLSGDLTLTKYVVWDNLGLSKEDRDLEAYQLMAYVCDKLDYNKGILNKYHQKYLNGEIDEETYIDNLNAIEYDMLYGDMLVYDGINPYEEVDMTLGLYTISVSEITYKNGYIYVYGENFNEYSVIVADDEELDTIYISSELLIAPMDDPPEELTLCVAQVGSDHETLGATELITYAYEARADVPDTGTYK